MSRGRTPPQASAAIRRRGFLLVLSSPSGAGKTTITQRLVEGDPTLSRSVSVTTRPARPGETDGADYRFIDQPRFDAMAAAGELLDRGDAIGRQLDFLCQELNREANTLCSKSADIELTRLGLSLKAAIEQFREQVQNLE